MCSAVATAVCALEYNCIVNCDREQGVALLSDSEQYCCWLVMSALGSSDLNILLLLRQLTFSDPCIVKWKMVIPLPENCF